MATQIPRHPEAFSKSPRITRRPRVTNEKHLVWIRTLPCLVSGELRLVEAAHVRFPDPRFGKRETGMAEKPDDRWTVPLCAKEHRTGPDAQHNSNERAWWARKGIDPVAVACALWGCSGDDEVANIIIREARLRARQVGATR